MKYPEIVLTDLEREPIVYFGCTWSEIVNAITRGFLVALPITIVLAIFPLPFSRVIAVVPFFGIWLWVTNSTMKKLRTLRAGKPLFYERHIRMVKVKNPFIDPSTMKQTERNR